MSNKHSISHQTFLLAANGHHANGRYFQSMLPHNVHKDVKDFFAGLPDYEDLFGSLDTQACDHDRSIFSPAAYFVDLMRLIEQHIDAPEGLRLRDRRPDLAKIPLDAENTTHEVPVLEIVNEVLATRLQAESTEDAYDALRSAKYPFDVPYDVPLERIRAYLKHYGIELATVYEALELDPIFIAEATLGLSHAESEFIQQSDTSLEGLSAAYGSHVNLSETLPVMVTQDWQEDADPPRATLLITKHDDETRYRAYDDEAKRLFYVVDSRLDDETCADLRKLIDWNLYPVGSGRHEPTLEVREKLHYVLRRQAKGSWGKTLVGELRDVESFLARTGMTQQEIEQLIDGDKQDYDGTRGGSNARRAAAKRRFVNRFLGTKLFAMMGLSSEKSHFQLELSGQEINYSISVTTELRPGVETQEPRRAGFGAWHVIWDLLHRFVRLSRRIGWSFADLDRALESVGAADIDESAILALAKIKKLMKRFDVPIDQLTCLWHDMFDDEFQHVFAKDSTDTCKVVVPAAGLAAGQRLPVPPWLSRALKTTDREFDLIFDFAKDQLETVGTFRERHTDRLPADVAPDGFPLSVHNLTCLYRPKRLSNLLGRSVEETLTLLRLLKIPLATIDDLLKVVSWDEWLTSAGLTVGQFGYMIAKLDAPAEVGYDKAAEREMLRGLSKTATKQPAKLRNETIIKGLASFHGVTSEWLNQLLLLLGDSSKDLNRSFLALSMFRFGTGLKKIGTLKEGTVSALLVKEFRAHGITLPPATLLEGNSKDG